MTLPVGTRLSSYEIVGKIASGGMGEVYRARDSKLSREVAIKVLPAALAGDTERLARFEKEARTVSALSHPNIVTIYDIGQADGTPFIAMELVAGKTLRELLSSVPMPLKKLLSIAAQVADGLAKAHDAGIVHRDLKPENVMVTREGFVKILDFGLAKLARAGFESSHGADRPTVSRLTEAGTVLGTVGYMSPEQASGEPVDFRSDHFSFGSILYEMASGRRAFERATGAQTLSAIIEAEPDSLATLTPRIPTNLVWIVERCLTKDPEDRYGSTRDLARDLAAMRDHSSGVSVSVEPPASRRLRLTRLGLVAAAIGVAGLAVLAYLAGERAQARRDREAPPPRRTTLTFRRGFVTGARFAPDGQTIVYSASWDGKPSEIFTARVGSTESRALGIAEAGILAVSSAGEMVITRPCISWKNHCIGTLARVPLAGGAPREILENVASADWSPDGKELAVTVYGGLQYPIGKVLYESEGYLSGIRVSPGGDLVAFIDHPQLDSSRGVLSVVDGAGKKKVLTGEWARGPSILWSPTGEEVFFRRWGSGEIRGASLSGRTRSAPWIPGLDDVSREGLFLDTGLLRENYRSVIRVRVPDEPAERNLSWLSGSTAADLSKDGRKLLLYEEGSNSSRPDEEDFTTFLRSTDGSDAAMLGEGRALALSPDEQWALVLRPPPESHLVLLPTGAGEPRALPGAGLVFHHRATFFPDGRQVLFTGRDKDGTQHSYIQSVEGGPPRLFGEEGLAAQLVSPDGRWIAGWAGDYRIYPSDGQGRSRPLGGSLPDDSLVQWSSDGKTIYARGPEDLLTIYRIDLATGRRERWKELSPPDRTGFLQYGPAVFGVGVSITPDGRHYAYTYLTDSSRLVLAKAGPDWWK